MCLKRAGHCVRFSGQFKFFENQISAKAVSNPLPEMGDNSRKKTSMKRRVLLRLVGFAIPKKWIP
jgi:hypothetical protein